MIEYVCVTTGCGKGRASILTENADKPHFHYRCSSCGERLVGGSDLVLAKAYKRIAQLENLLTLLSVAAGPLVTTSTIVEQALKDDSWKK